MKLPLSPQQKEAFREISSTDTSHGWGIERLAAVAISASRLDQVTSLDELLVHLVGTEIQPQLNPYGLISVLLPDNGGLPDSAGQGWGIAVHTQGFGLAGDELGTVLTTLGYHMRARLEDARIEGELLPEAVAEPSDLAEWLGEIGQKYPCYSHAFTCRFAGEPAGIIMVTRCEKLRDSEREDMRSLAAIFGAALARLVHLEKGRFVGGRRPSNLFE